MAGLLVLGAIPSGLAGTAHTVEGLHLIRFFIGMLGAIFVTCQAWTTAFFDKNVVGRGNWFSSSFDFPLIQVSIANALAAGWGNAGGGITFVVMIALYNSLLSAGLVPHVAWRAAFAIVPVPILLSVATAVMVFGTDHPAGKWSDRHKAIARPIGGTKSSHLPEDVGAHTPTDENKDDLEKKGGFADVRVTVAPVDQLSASASFL